jgi:hypothetical protein
LIQHSFALRLPERHQPFARAGNLKRIQERFALAADRGAAFDVKSVCDPHSPLGVKGDTAASDHSPLVEHGKTTVHPLPVDFPTRLPSAFQWAEMGTEEPNCRRNEPKLIFAEISPKTGQVSCNDFLVERQGCDLHAQLISWTLLKIIAHKRSRLLGLALANRVVSVMLPHAVLTQVDDDGRIETSAGQDRSWFVQPLASFIRDGRVKSEFRDSYSLTLLLIPVTGKEYRQREMTRREIDRTVNAGWGLAMTPTDAKLTRFQARGPLVEYLQRLNKQCDPTSLLRPSDSGTSSETGGCGESLTLRRCTEVLAFGLGLRLVQGSGGKTIKRTRRRIGDDVVTSLGSARVSSVLVLDKITRKQIRKGKNGPLRGHRNLIATLSRATRVPAHAQGYRKYRLDRPFVDDDTYVAGVVPTKRCLVVSCTAEAQHGLSESGLTQAGSLTHMTIGAAIAIGALRAVDRDLEEMEAADPRKIAAVGGEIAIDLCEIYDLDITSEAYRNLYRLLRKRLGITRDYKTLQSKMEALYRATSTEHEVKTQARLVWLTAWIVALSLLILIGTIVAVGKG